MSYDLRQAKIASLKAGIERLQGGDQMILAEDLRQIGAALEEAKTHNGVHELYEAVRDLEDRFKLLLDKLKTNEGEILRLAGKSAQYYEWDDA